jgi:hygromycin-B 7''-O-kinase
VTVDEGRSGAASGGATAVLPREALAELARLLGLGAVPEAGRAWAGATSTVVRWGADLTVKVPHDDPAAVEACLRHVRVSDAARHLGIVCPEVLLTADLGSDVPVPVIVSRFLPGAALEPGNTRPGVWRAVGAQLALLHAAPPSAVPRGLRRFTQTSGTDPAAMLGRLVATGTATSEGAARLLALRNRLRPFVLPDADQVFCHGDLHAGNVIADDDRFAGLVDFAGAGWLDAAWDFAAIPLGAVPSAIGGYAAAGGVATALLERIAWCRLQLALGRGLEDARRLDFDSIVGAAESLLPS